MEAWLICNQIYRQAIGTPGEKPPSPIISRIGTTRILLTAYPAKKRQVYEYIQNESILIRPNPVALNKKGQTSS